MDTLTWALGIFCTILIVFVGWVGSQVTSMKVKVGKTESIIEGLVKSLDEYKTQVKEDINELKARVLIIESKLSNH